MLYTPFQSERRQEEREKTLAITAVSSLGSSEDDDISTDEDQFWGQQV